MAVHLAAVYGDIAGGRAAAGAMGVGLPKDGLQLRENWMGILDSEIVVGRESALKDSRISHCGIQNYFELQSL